MDQRAWVNSLIKLRLRRVLFTQYKIAWLVKIRLCTLGLRLNRLVLISEWVSRHLQLLRRSQKSIRHGGFGGLSPPNKVPIPQIEIWNTINQSNFCQIWMSTSPHTRKAAPHKRNDPLLKLFWRRFWIPDVCSSCFEVTPTILLGQIKSQFAVSLKTVALLF